MRATTRRLGVIAVCISMQLGVMGLAMAPASAAPVPVSLLTYPMWEPNPAELGACRETALSISGTDSYKALVGLTVTSLHHVIFCKCSTS